MMTSVDADELMTIGRFAHVSGLSIHTLRHYDDVGLLVPAETDPDTGYRRYRRRQIRTARMIRVLRCIDLPVEQVRQILVDRAGTDTRGVLSAHRRRLSRQQEQLADRIAQVDRYLEGGITMPTISGCRPVQLKIAVDDAEAAVTFYQEAFGFRYEVTRRAEDDDYSSFIFGNYGQDGFFLLHLKDDPSEADRPGPTTFGLSVDDLDAVHARALSAGATEVTAPHDAQGMPRCSAVRDPSGNWIWLYQG